MKTWILKLFRTVLAFMGVTAVASCDSAGILLMYGTPTLDYTVSGKVVNAKDELLKDVKVKPLIFDDTTGVYQKDTVFVPLSRVAAGEYGDLGVYEAKDVKVTMEKN